MTNAKRLSLLQALRRAQGLFGRIQNLYLNDRAKERATDVVTATQEGFDMCVAALAPYPSERLRKATKDETP